MTWRGAAETAILLVAVFGVWMYVSFEATLLDVARKATQWAVIIVMGLGLFLNAGISHAFDTQPWAFVIPLLTIQVGQDTPPFILRHKSFRIAIPRAQGPPRQCSMRLWSGVNPCFTPHRTAWVRLPASILR